MCRRRARAGIVVMNAPGANSVSVAELAMALDPGAGATHSRRRRRDEARQVGEEEVPGRGSARQDRSASSGLGRIGQEVARRASAFGMTIVAHDPFVSEQTAAQLDVELVGLDDLFARADYVSLHMPSTDAARVISSTPNGWRSAEEGHPHRQHRARRPHRRSGAGRRHRSRDRLPAPRSTCSRKSRRSTIGCRCCRRS